MSDALETFTRRCAYAGVSLLLLCAAFNVGDIVTRRSINLSIVGMVDVTQLMVMSCAFLCIPFTFMREAHIDVDFVVNHFSARLREAVMGLWSLTGTVFMGIVTWFASVAALQAYANNDQSTTIGMPIVWYWMPLLFGCALSVLACAALTVRHWARAARS